MAENVGGIFYDVTLETQGLLNSQRTVERSLKQAGDAGDAFQSRMTKVAAAVGAAIAAIGVEKLADKLIKTQREFDVMFSSLTTAAGGLDAANREFERLQKFAEQTPYTLAQSVNGFTKLVNLGLDPSERAMRSFGDTAAAMGKDLMQMIEAVADASTGEFERLKEFGIKSKAEGDKVTFTFRGVKTEVQNNAADITEYLTRLGESNFAGAMAERMKTLDGAISNLGDTWDKLFLTVSKSGVGDAIASGVRMATEAIGQAEMSVRRGELTGYFDAMRPAIAAVEVVAVSLAGAMAGKLVSSIYASTAALVAKAQASRAAAAESVAMAQAELAAAQAAQKSAVAHAAMGAQLHNVTAASARVAAAQEALAVAQQRQTAATGAAAAASRAASGVMAALGGPIGIAITALALLALNWDKVSGSAKNAATVAEESAQRIKAALSRTGGMPLKDLKDQLAEAEGEFKKLDTQLDLLGTKARPAKDMIPFERDVLERWQAWGKVIEDTKKAITEVDAGGGRGFVNPPSVTPRPETGPEPETPQKGKGKTEAEYLAELRLKAAENAWAKINEQERAGLAENEKALKEGTLRSAAAKARADAMVRKAAANARAAQQEEDVRELQAHAERMRQEEERLAQEFEGYKQKRQQGEQLARETIAGANPIDAVRFEEERRLAAIEEYRQLDLQNSQIYEDAKVAIKQAAAEKIRKIEEDTKAKEQAALSAQLQNYGNLFGSVAGLTKAFAGEQSSAYKAMFAVSKAFAIADSILKIQQAMASAAMSVPFPGNLGAIATVAASTAGIVSTIAGTNFGGGRQYGGPVSAGSLYRVNETGQPEMFTAANGAQYMMPTASGRVTAADKVGRGGGVAWTINVHNAPPGTTATVDEQTRIIDIAVARSVGEVAGQIGSNTGKVWSALRGATNVQGRM